MGSLVAASRRLNKRTQSREGAETQRKKDFELGSLNFARWCHLNRKMQRLAF
jgi:hypothetical protein